MWHASLTRILILDVARVLDAHFVVLNASSSSEIESAFATIASERMGALVVSIEVFFVTQRDLLVALAARYRIPAIYEWREFVQAGGLMSYGSNLANGFQQIGIYAGRILKGEKINDLPVQQATKIELAINLKTAKALGITVPPAILARADEVIE
jgi:putative ABC transport system substrate-binding protein